MDLRRILIVANQTAAGDHLKQYVKDQLTEGRPSRFTLLVPATPTSDHLTWTEGEAQALAEERMNEALAGLRETGAEVEGIVGDPRPLSAIGDVLLEQPHDEIVLSTFPLGVSRWLKQDLPHRVERQFRLPVTHIVGEPSANT
jgi:GABA permease